MEPNLEASLKWLLGKRYGTQNVRDLGGFNDNVSIALVNADTCTEVAVAVDEVRVHTLEALADAVSRAILCDAPGVSEISCIVVWKDRCTLKQDDPVTTVMTSKDVAVHCELFEQTRIVNHPFLYNIVPSDYHRATPAELAEARRIATPLSRLPVMLESDAVARILGFRRGDVVAFTRCLGSLPPATAFRYVVK